MARNVYPTEPHDEVDCRHAAEVCARQHPRLTRGTPGRSHPARGATPGQTSAGDHGRKVGELELGDHLNGEAGFDGVGGRDPGGQWASFEELRRGGREQHRGTGRGCLVGVGMTAADRLRLALEDGICRNVGNGEGERHGNAMALRADQLTYTVVVLGARYRDGDCANPLAVEIDHVLAGW